MGAPAERRTGARALRSTRGRRARGGGGRGRRDHRAAGSGGAGRARARARPASARIQAGGEMSQKPSNRGAPHRLLIVDDDPLIRLLARERLGSEAFDVYEAGSGAEGVEVFADVSPDLVLLDVEM